MRKLKFLFVLLVTVCMTGCVKMNASMTINKDKSMDYEIIMAFDESLLQGTNNGSVGMSEEEIQSAKDNGFKIEDYAEENMKGYKLVKHVDNIDSISTKDNITGSLDADGKDEYIFTIKKGFFKNTYTAKLTSSTTDKISDGMGNTDDVSTSFPATTTINSDSNLTTTTDNSLTTTTTTNNNLTTTTNDSLYDTTDSSIYDTTDDSDLTIGDDSTDYSSLMSSMDLKFEVNLPYKAKSNNATKVENGGKKLVWDLASLANEQAIEFQFDIYNMTSIYIVGGTALIVFILIIVLCIGKIRNKKANKKNGNQVQPTTEVVTDTTTVQPIAEVAPVQPEVQPVAEVAPVQPEVQPVADVAPVQPEVQPVADVAPVQPEVQPVTDVAPVQPEVQPVADVAPVQPEVQPVTDVAPVQPEVQPVADVAPVQPEVQPVADVAPVQQTDINNQN